MARWMTHVSTQLRQIALKQAGHRCEKLVVRILDRRWPIVTGETVKDLCQQDLGLYDDQEEGRGLAKETEKGKRSGTRLISEQSWSDRSHRTR